MLPEEFDPAGRLRAAGRLDRGRRAAGQTGFRITINQRVAAMMEMPPLQFAKTNGIRMGYYEAGPKTDPRRSPRHGWPEIAFSWRHQIEALAGPASGRSRRISAATAPPSGPRPRGLRYRAPHRRPLGLLDHLGIEKAIFVGHDWGGFVVWQMPLRHLDRVAGVIGINTPHPTRAADPIAILRQLFGEDMYIVQFQDPAREPDRIFAEPASNRPSTSSCVAGPRPADPAARAAGAGVGASPRLNLAFPQIIADYDRQLDPRTPILSPDEMKVFVDTFPQNRLYRRHQLVPQHVAQLAALGGIRPCRAGAHR